MKRVQQEEAMDRDRKSVIGTAFPKGSLVTHNKLCNAHTFYPFPASGIQPKDIVPVQEDIHTAYVYGGVYNCEKLNTVFTPNISDRLGQYIEAR